MHMLAWTLARVRTCNFLSNTLLPPSSLKAPIETMLGAWTPAKAEKDKHAHAHKHTRARTYRHKYTHAPALTHARARSRAHMRTHTNALVDLTTACACSSLSAAHVSCEQESLVKHEGCVWECTLPNGERVVRHRLTQESTRLADGDALHFHEGWGFLHNSRASLSAVQEMHVPMARHVCFCNHS